MEGFRCHARLVLVLVGVLVATSGAQPRSFEKPTFTTGHSEHGFAYAANARKTRQWLGQVTKFWSIDLINLNKLAAPRRRRLTIERGKGEVRAAAVIPRCPALHSVPEHCLQERSAAECCDMLT